MYKVIYEEVEIKVETLDDAMACAKVLNRFVTIKGNGMVPKVWMVVGIVTGKQIGRAHV